MIEVALEVVLDVGAESDELRAGMTGGSCSLLPRSSASEKARLCCQEVGGGSEALRECEPLDSVERDCLLLLLLEEWREEVLSGITATLITSVLGRTALEARL